MSQKRFDDKLQCTCSLAQSIVPGSPPSCLLRHMSDDKVLRDPAVFNLVLDFYRTGRLHTRKEVQFQ